MQIVVKLIWMCCFLASIVSVLIFLAIVAPATTAPQQAAGAAIACFCVMMPYIFARSVEKMVIPWPKKEKKKKQEDPTE